MENGSIQADNLGADGDAFYTALMVTHEGLSEVQSHALNARLVLMMANQIGDLNVLKSLLSSARDVK
ncbi:MAG: DUF2783 domain-containing protein [Stappiaceae bacterium]